MRLYVILKLILCCVQILKSGTVSLMYKMSLVHLRIKPRQPCQHLQIGNHTKPLMYVINGTFNTWIEHMRLKLLTLTLCMRLNNVRLVCETCVKSFLEKSSFYKYLYIVVRIIHSICIMVRYICFVLYSENH